MDSLSFFLFGYFFFFGVLLQDSKDAKAAKQAHLQAQIDRQKRQIRRKMGTVNYYLNCSARRRYVAQIVVVDPEEEEAKLLKAKQEEMAKAQTEQARASKAKQGASLFWNYYFEYSF